MLDENSEHIISHASDATQLPRTPEIDDIGGQTHHEAKAINEVLSKFDEGEVHPAPAGEGVPTNTTPQEVDSAQFEKPSILNHPSIKGFLQPEIEKPSTWARITSRLRGQKKVAKSDRGGLTEGGKRAA